MVVYSACQKRFINLGNNSLFSCLLKVFVLFSMLAIRAPIRARDHLFHCFIVRGKSSVARGKATHDDIKTNYIFY